MSIKVFFEGIWGAILIAFTIILSPLLRRWYSHWGMSVEEARQPLPGDEYVPQPRSEVNAVVTVRALPDGTTRLKFRMRTDWNPSFGLNLVYRGIVEPISFVMGRKMLARIKQRAER